MDNLLGVYVGIGVQHCQAQPGQSAPLWGCFSVLNLTFLSRRGTGLEAAIVPRGLADDQPAAVNPVQRRCGTAEATPVPAQPRSEVVAGFAAPPGWWDSSPPGHDHR
jgi:hypothetical protein